MYVPEAFALQVKVGEQSGWVFVNQDYFERISQGAQVEVDVQYGRFTRRLRIKNIYG